MKRIYSLYAAAFSLVLAGAVLLLTPPRTVYACTGSATCLNGESIRIPDGATTVSARTIRGVLGPKTARNLPKTVRSRPETYRRRDQ